MITKDVWYEVTYCDVTISKLVVATRKFKSQKSAKQFYDSLDSRTYDKHFLMFEKSILDYSESEKTANKFKSYFERN